MKMSESGLFKRYFFPVLLISSNTSIACVFWEGFLITARQVNLWPCRCQRSKNMIVCLRFAQF